MATTKQKRVNLKKFLAPKSLCACFPWKGAILYDDELRCAVATEGHALIISFSDYANRPNNFDHYLKLAHTERRFLCDYVYDKFFECGDYPDYRSIMPDEDLLELIPFRSSDFKQASEQLCAELIASGFYTKGEVKHGRLDICGVCVTNEHLQRMALLPEDGTFYVARYENEYKHCNRIIYRNDNYLALFAPVIATGNEKSIYELLTYTSAS